MRFDIDVHERDGSVYVAVDGELDLATAPLLDAQLTEVEATTAETILIDLSRVPFMDSAGLEVLLSAKARSADDGRLRLAACSPQVERLIDVSGVRDRLPLLASTA